MKNILLTTFLILNLNAWSQNIQFEWNKILGTEGPNVGLCIGTDTDGFIYTAGCFSNTINFLGTSLTSSGMFDAYLAKLSASGELIWVKQFAGAYDDKITALEIDRDNNIYVCGTYRVQIEFDTLLVTNNRDKKYSSNMFIAKYDASGTLIWAKNTGGVEVIGSKSGPVEFAGPRLAIDGRNNLIIAGQSVKLEFFDTLDQVETLDSAKVCSDFGNPENCHWDYFHPTYNFLAKYSADGEKIWIKQLGGCPYTVKADTNNDIIVSGYFKCLNSPCFAEFDGTQLQPIAGNTIFLVKYNGDGNLSWARTAGGLANANTGYDLAISRSSDIYLTGQVYCGEVKFGSDIVVSVPCSNTNAFLAKIDQSGTFRWAKILGNPQVSNDGDYNAGNSIALSDNGIFVTGYFKGSYEFGGTSVNAFNAMIVEKFDFEGNILNAGIYGNSGMGSAGKQLTLDQQGNVLVTGYTFQGATEGNAPAYIFMGKIDHDLPTRLMSQEKYDPDADIFPNPVADQLIVRTKAVGIKTIQIISSDGLVVFSDRFADKDFEINCAFLTNGIYFAKISIAGNLVVKKLLKK